MSYFNRFVAALPTVQHLAAAPEQQVFKLWEGLGYYSRCRNLIATAKYIIEERRGIFPVTYEELLGLKGVGSYTAAAIASFAYNLPYAVLDGNVYRVLSRIYCEETSVDTTKGKKLFGKLAQDLLPINKAGAYNQALMDFGATICKPLPECNRCFFNDQCLAFLARKQAALPIKSKKGTVKNRWFYYFILQHNDNVAIRLRSKKDIWQGLYETLLIESAEEWSKQQWTEALEKEFGVVPAEYDNISATARVQQRLTHQKIHFYFIHLQLKTKPQLNGFKWETVTKLSEYPFPKTLAAYLQKNL
jgi:A/G-specific adenine glycosylase